MLSGKGVDFSVLGKKTILTNDLNIWSEQVTDELCRSTLTKFNSERVIYVYVCLVCYISIKEISGKYVNMYVPSVSIP